MASVLLASAGSSAAGGLKLGPLGSAAGRQLGRSLGNYIDDAIFGARRLPDVQGRRLEDLAVQTSTYGNAIPIVYGTVRIAGNVVWSRPIKETANKRTASSGGKGGGGKVVQNSTNYTYSASLAIAICEGEIDDILRVWADSKAVDLTQGTYRLYKGTETQNPDSFIESFEGSGKTPAYRGVAYVVIEDFPLGDFGNRIPNFTFEVRRKVAEANSVEDRIKSVMVIPGSGEFVYDTAVQQKVPGQLIGSEWVQKGERENINNNNREGKADAVVSVDQMLRDMPNLEWVSIVVGWFGTSLDAGSCLIKPGVEYADGSITSPNEWAVGSYDRSSAHLITQVDSRPVYGGTPDDGSLLAYIAELKSRGLKVMFYPFVFMDVADNSKPWRGRISGTVAETASFFTKTEGYNDFIEHYASLLSDKVDVFCIGSELKDLTTLRDTSDDSFPAVDELVSLASTASGLLDSSVKVTYAADWSEYHHNDDGWYHLDSLWASADIDYIGVDAYFPLTDEEQNGYSKQKIIDGWTSGEGYDWYYSDAGRTTQTSLDEKYAWKDIDWWWKNSHVNPDMSTTSWVPQSKKIWFTEFGFPSVDGCANQPNVFYDPNSSESAFPYHSRGRVDFRAQRVAIEGTLDQWENSTMVERMFLWTWDARPYPYFPDLREVWSDGDLWIFGHWVNGKFGLSSVANIIEDLCVKAGLQVSEIDTSDIYELLEGLVIDRNQSIRGVLEDLQKGYFFEPVENDDKLKFVSRGSDSAKTIVSDDLLLIRSEGRNLTLKTTRKQEIELPKKVDVEYLDKVLNYQNNTQHSQREVTTSAEKLKLALPLVMNEFEARRIAEVAMYNSWISRNSFEFSLQKKYAELEPTDVVSIVGDNATYTVRISEVLAGQNGEIKIKGVAEDANIYDFYSEPKNDEADNQTVAVVQDTRFEILDLPAFPTDDPQKAYIRFAACGYEGDWPGAVIYRSDDGGDNYDSYLDITQPATIGNAIGALPDGSTDYFDETSTVNISLTSGSLESRTELAVLNGANLALIGEEIIQFKNATLVSENEYQLSGLLRGKLGTEDKVYSHAAGERFVLLDEAIVKQEVPALLIGLSRKYKAVTINGKLADFTEQDFAYQANGLKPLSPVHVEGERDGSGNLTVSWVRRTRIGGELQDGVDVPLSEVGERYEVDIMDGSNVVRTISSTSPSVSYSSAEQTTDFGSQQPSISVKIYQMSDIVGRGNISEATV